MNEPWRIQLFGTLRAQMGDRVVTRFRTQKTSALLAYLAYYRGRSHAREYLIEMLWPDSEPESGRHNLSLALSSLRSQLEPPGVPDGAVVVADRFSVELNPEAFTTDVQAFEQAVRRAVQARNEPDRRALLAEAADAYGGVLLPGHYDDWVEGEREHLVQRYAQTVVQLLSVMERDGDIEGALACAQQAAAHTPLHDEMQRTLMRLLGDAGDLDGALRHYALYARRLEEETSEQPGAATRALAEEIAGRLKQRSGRPAPVPAERPGRAAAAPAAPALPSGTVTFLFTDIEGSTALWERAGDAFRSTLSLHHALLRREFRRFGGYEAKEAGDSFVVSFQSASDGLACAVACQRALAAQQWPGAEKMTPTVDGPSSEPPPAGQTSPADPPLRVRMALHTGDVEADEGEYHGLVLHRGARILAAAHGEQIVCSEATAALVRRDLEQDVHLRDLGVYRLRGVAEPERLFQVGYPGMATVDFPPLLAEPARQAHLPIQFTRFFGREQEIEALVQALSPTPGSGGRGTGSASVPGAEPRLVTLTGPGGSGKTRLAIEVAARLAESFDGAVWFVPLADLPDAALLNGAIVDALGVPRDPNTPSLDQAVGALSHQRSLLLLDNFEHLLDGAAGSRPGADAAGAVHGLLERVPDLVCLVTSRRPLGLPGEREFAVPPLPTPSSGADSVSPERLSVYESVRLFVDRAQAAKPDFRVTNQNAPAVAELCDRLEGLPLAIELAAARALVLTPTQMLAQLANRFEFLVSSSRRRGVSERQRTLRAAIDWSYRLLAPDLQRFFARLSVFRGGWTVEAAEEVCGEPLALDFLAQLREGSLVLVDECDSCLHMRFRLLETLREYAADRLAQLGAAELSGALRRHAALCVRLASEAEPHLTGPDQATWLRALQADRDNLRAVLAWCAQDPPADSSAWDIGLRLCNSLWRFWSIRGYSRDGRRMLERLLEQVPVGSDGETAALRARAHDAAGALAHDMCDYAGAEAHLQESLAHWRTTGEAPQLAHTLNLLANVALDGGNAEVATPLYEEALALYRQTGDRRGTAMVLGNLGALALISGQPERAATLLDESLRIKRSLGNRYSLAIGLENLGNVERSLNRPERGAALHAEALAIRRELGHVAGIAMSCSNLGQALVLQGEPGRLPEAAAHLREALGLFDQIGDLRGLAECLVNVAALAGRLGRYDESARLAGGAAALREERALAVAAADAEVEKALLAPVREALPDGRYALLEAEGGRLGQAGAIDLAQTLLAPPAS